MAKYYITQTGSGDGSSIGSAMGIATHNTTTFAPNDIIVLSGVITSEVIVISSGISENNIIYDGNDGTAPQGHIERTFTYSQRGLFAENVAFIDFQNIEISITDNGAKFEACHDLNFYNNYIHDTLSRGLWIDGLNEGASNNIIVGGSQGKGNEIKNIGRGTGSGDVSFVHVRDSVISYNTLHADKGTGLITDAGLDGVVGYYSYDILVEYNVISNHWDLYAPDPLLPADYNVWGEENIQTIVTGDIVGYSDIMEDGTSTGTLSNRYEARSNLGSIDLNATDFTNATNWDDLGKGNSALEGTGEDGMDLKPLNYNWVVRFNTFENNLQTGITCQMGSNNIEIYGNYFSSNYWAGVIVKYGAGNDPPPPFYACHDISTHHNIFVDNYEAGVNYATSGDDPDSAGTVQGDNIDTWNNVFVNNGHTPPGNVKSNIGYISADGDIRNNILVDGRSGEYNAAYAGTSVITADNNIYFNTDLSTSETRYGSGYTYYDSIAIPDGNEANGQEVNPLFVSDTDFNLQVLSTGRGAGEEYSTLNANMVDYINKALGTPRDIGAYDYNEGTAIIGNFRLTGISFSNNLGILKRALTGTELTYLNTTPEALGIIANGGTDTNLPNLTQADFSNYVAFDEGVGTAHDDITASDYTLDDGAVWVEL